jgi:ribosomal protein L34
MAEAASAEHGHDSKLVQVLFHIQQPSNQQTNQTGFFRFRAMTPCGRDVPVQYRINFILPGNGQIYLQTRDSAILNFYGYVQ